MATSEEFKLDIGRCSVCAIRHQAVCGALADHELQRLNQISRRRVLTRGQIVMSDDDRAEFFANVVSGVIKLAKTMPDGRQQIVGLLFAPDFVGRTYAENNPYFAEAATDVELCCFPRDAFEAVLHEYPGLEHRLFERTLDELDSAREWMLLLGRKSAQEKVASFLFLLAKRSLVTGCPHHEAPSTPVFELPLTRADIADYLGLTIETVSRQITKLKTAGLINLIDTHHMAIPDLHALCELAGQEMPTGH
jgi:CRP/FNR family transcriptional regulator